MYIPREIENRLKLSDGDQATIEVIDEKSFKVSLKRTPKTTSVEDRLIDKMINKPFTGKLATRHFKREDFYDKS